MTTVLHKGEDCHFVQSPLKPRVTQKRRGDSKRQTIRFLNPPKISGGASVVTQKEAKGPLGKYFEEIITDPKLSQKCFENAEIQMIERSVAAALNESGISIEDLDLLLSGDLLNQLTSSSYAARSLNIPYMGLYSACSTFTEALIVGAGFISSGYHANIACVAASHFATAERQYRYPLEYGSQRPPYAQWTVSAAGCSILSSEGNGPRITAATIGKVVDFGVNDISNMGAAMAPAAMDTLTAMFKETGTGPEDYDMIATGDLGKLGSDILRDLLREQGYELGQNYADCGGMIYDVTQKCYQGGSGAGCSSSVFNSYILKKLASGEYKKVILAATGALMSPQSCYQGETIPSICHAVIIEN